MEERNCRTCGHPEDMHTENGCAELCHTDEEGEEVLCDCKAFVPQQS